MWIVDREVQSTTTSINFEAELDKPYGKALKEIYSDEQIKRALIYMNQKGTFSNQMKTSTIIGKTIEHIKNVDEWASKFSIERDLETNFPKELPKPDLINRLLQFKEWDHAEITLILDETFKSSGFFPIPTEFFEIYEEKKGRNSSTDRHNDLFGLTIFQFEREFKACLERRKQNEPQILNILFPIKTSDRYLEYLENTHSQQTDHTSLFSSREKEIYDNLIRVVGSEMDVRIRQKMFPIMDKICNKMDSEIIKISSGSLAEGLDLPGSDMDIIFVLNCVQFIQNVQHMKRSPRYPTLLLDDDMEIPGYSRLKLIAEGDHTKIFTQCFTKTKNGTFLPSVSFLHKFIEVFKHQQVAHGPCFSSKDESVDTVCCFRLPTWPRQAEQWIYRHRPGQWPSEILIDDIVKYGCTLVPIGPKEIENSELLWRISFSVAEKQLFHAMNYTQILCYALLKLSLKNIIDRNSKVNGLLCSYFMKTALFWLSEEISTNAFQLKNLFHCYFLCLDKLITWVKDCYCPNYFIPENNMFRGKINRSNSSQLLHVLEKLRNGECEVFAVTALFNSEAVLYEPCIKLETFVYRVLNTDIRVGLGNEYTTLSFIKSLAMSQSTGILSGICNYHYSRASQMIVQKLPVPTTNRHNAHVIRRYHKHLQDGTKSDAVSGWLLYASFYYVLGQYNTTLKIIDYVLSRCTPDMLEIGDNNYTTDDIKYYTQNVGCSKITLNEKMRLATVDGVGYVKQSTLIPHELKLEVHREEYFSVQPIVLSHCLRFLCYHHLNNIDNRQQSLSDLDLAVNEKKCVSESISSKSLTILGVCYEIVGERLQAILCYHAALQEEGEVWPTANERIENLSMSLIMSIFQPAKYKIPFFFLKMYFILLSV